MNRKVQAFTILEVTVAMLLSAVAIGITYTAFTIVSRSYITYDRRNRDVSELLLADKLFKQDFIAANNITRTENGLQIQMPGGIVEYQLTDSLIIRDQFGLRTDTFKLAVQDVAYRFENLESVPGTRVDKLSLQTRVEKEPFSLSYTKLYSSKDLIGSQPSTLNP